MGADRHLEQLSEGDRMAECAHRWRSAGKR
jgi:uncharacterized protein (DUF2237 family)